MLVKTQDKAATKYWYGNERLCFNEDFYLYDGQGSVTILLSGYNSILSTYSYSDYGRRDKKYNPFTSGSDEYGYRSEAHNSDETQYLRARYYDTVTELFISADGYRGNWQDPLSQNRYNYGRNNPNKYFDPTGKWSLWGAVKNTVNKVVNTVKKTVNNVVNTVKKTVNNVVNTVKNTFNPPKQNPAPKKNNNNPTDARTAPPIYSQYDKAIQHPTNSGGNKPTNNNPTSTTRPFNNTSSPSQTGNSYTSQNIMQLTKEKNLAIISSLKDSTAALTKKQEEKRKVDAIMASIQGPQFNVDFFNKIGSLYNRVSGWCNERGKEIKEVGENFKKGGKELGDQLNEALLGGLQSVSDSVVAVSEAISNMTWKDWKKAAISFTAGTATFAVLFVPGGGVVGAVVNGFVAGGMAGAAGSIAGDSYEVVDAIASKNQDELFKKYGVKDWAELGNRVLDQAGTSMVKGAIFGSLAAGTQEYIGSKLNSNKNESWSESTSKIDTNKDTGTVWDSIKPTQPILEGIEIPKSFNITVDGQEFWVHPNATKHMYQYITRNTQNIGSFTTPINSQSMLNEFASALKVAIAKEGLKIDELIYGGNWEFMITTPREEGLNYVIKHAKFNR